jgi:hypothetical protein
MNTGTRSTIGILLIAIVVFLSAMPGISLASPTGPAINIEVISLECGPKVSGNTVQLIYCIAKVRITNTGNTAFSFVSYGYTEGTLQVGFPIFEAVLPGQVAERTIHIPANVSGERSISFYAHGEGMANGKSFYVFAGVNRTISCPIPNDWPKPDIRVNIVPNMGISESGNTYTSFYIQFENRGEVPVSYVYWKYKLTMGAKETTGNQTMWYGIYTGKAVSGNVTLYAPCGDVRIEVEISSHYWVEFPDGQGAREYNLSATDTFVGRAPCACEDAVTVNAVMRDQKTLQLTGNWAFAQDSGSSLSLGTWIVRPINGAGEIQGHEKVILWRTETPVDASRSEKRKSFVLREILLSSMSCFSTPRMKRSSTDVLSGRKLAGERGIVLKRERKSRYSSQKVSSSRFGPATSPEASEDGLLGKRCASSPTSH